MLIKLSATVIVTKSLILSIVDVHDSLMFSFVIFEKC